MSIVDIEIKRKLHSEKMKPVRVYFVRSFLKELYCLKVCSFQLMKNRGVAILKLMGMYSDPYYKKINRTLTTLFIDV
ncbi:hypothetical protein C6352_29265 [Bacillus thuringiensis]|nr:hypothetical protein C6352_29265 [Bacillus thuringiensis]